MQCTQRRSEKLKPTYTSRSTALWDRWWWNVMYKLLFIVSFLIMLVMTGVLSTECLAGTRSVTHWQPDHERRSVRFAMVHRDPDYPSLPMLRAPNTGRHPSGVRTELKSPEWVPWFCPNCPDIARYGTLARVCHPCKLWVGRNITL